MPMGTQLYLKYSWLKPVLFFFLGDPDEGRKIEFEKK